MNDPPSKSRLRLSGEFATPSLEAWREQVDGGRVPYESMLWQPDDGVSAPPLFTAADLEDLPHLGLLPPRPAGGRWRVRERIAAASPELAAEQARRAVAGGAAELELRLDTCFFEIGPDEAGLCGIPVAGPDELATALAPVDLANTALCLDGDAVLGLALLLVHAKRQGIDPGVLHGELGLDPIEGLDTLDGPVPGAARFGEAAALLSWCAENAPGLRPLSLHSRRCHEAGASAALELACLLTGAIETVRQLAARGHDFAAVAAGLSLRVPVSTATLAEVAKLRALRLLWAKVAAAFTPSGEPLPAVPITAYSSERGRARRFDLRTNLLRGTLEAVAATLGGCDALCLEPYDPHPDYQNDEARLLARHQHALLRDEAFFDRVDDPTAGSYAMERLTHDTASRAWEILQEIETVGGLLAALREGLIMRRLLRSGAARLSRLRRRQQVRVGLNRYVDPELEGERHRVVDRAALVAKTEQRVATSAGEDGAGEHALTALREAFEARPADLVPAAVAAVEAGCTAFDLAEALEDLAATEVGDEPSEFTPSAEFGNIELEDVDPDLLVTDATDFEDLRAMLREAGTPPRALVLAVGANRTARQRADFAADLLRAGGFELARAEIADDPAAVADAAGQHDPELVVLCSDDERQGELCGALSGTPPSPRPVLAMAGRPREELQPHVDVFVYEGADLLLRLDYLAKLVELQRLERDKTNDQAAELRESLESTVATLRACIEREGA